MPRESFPLLPEFAGDEPGRVSEAPEPQLPFLQSPAARKIIPARAIRRIVDGSPKAGADIWLQALSRKPWHDSFGRIEHLPGLRRRKEDV
jgi:hypothetical protein